MSVSEVKIANMALSHLGTRSRIESLTENSNEAAEASLWLDFARTQTLSAFDWSFARKRITLTLHADDPPEGVWLYRYSYPADCIEVRHLVNPIGADEDAVPYDIETSDDGTAKTIVTDLDEAKLVYTFEQLDTNLYTPWFILAMSFLLASHMAIALTGKTSLKEAMFNNFIGSLVNAQAVNANETVGRKPREAEHIRARA